MPRRMYWALLIRVRADNTALALLGKNLFSAGLADLERDTDVNGNFYFFFAAALWADEVCLDHINIYVS